jgi:hypothetical protein
MQSIIFDSAALQKQLIPSFRVELFDTALAVIPYMKNLKNAGGR